MIRSGHIIASGSGLGSFEALCQYVLSWAEPAPAVGFLPTASGDKQEQIDGFYRVFEQRSCRADHLGLFYRRENDIADWFKRQDIIFVGGGNTANMLAVWRTHGVDTLLGEFLAEGKIVVGGSAGGLCWFEGGITDSFGPELAALQDGLGFLRGSFCPHFDSEPLRKPAFSEALRSGALLPGYALDDWAALHFVGGHFHEALALRAGARAFFFNKEAEGKILEMNGVF